MEVGDLLTWLARAIDRHNRNARMPSRRKGDGACMKKALIETQPAIDDQGYVANLAEFELAQILMYSLDSEDIYRLLDDHDNSLPGRVPPELNTTPEQPAPVAPSLTPPDDLLGIVTRVLEPLPDHTISIQSSPLTSDETFRYVPRHPTPSPTTSAESEATLPSAEIMYRDIVYANNPPPATPSTPPPTISDWEEWEGPDLVDDECEDNSNG